MQPTCHPDADAFMRRILADPGDAMARLVFADWLEECGGASNTAWAGYLRITEEIQHTSRIDPRRPKLLAEQQRLGKQIRARLKVRGEIFAENRCMMERILPLHCLRVSLQTFMASPSVCRLIPRSVAMVHAILPLMYYPRHVPRTLVLATSNPGFGELVRHVMNADVITVTADREEILMAVQRIYDSVGIDENSDHTLEDDFTAEFPSIDVSRAERWVELILGDACTTDPRVLHVEIEPTATEVRVWFERTDGRFEWDGLPRRMLEPVITHLRRISLFAGYRDFASDFSIRFWHRGQIRPMPVHIEPTAHGPLVRISVTTAAAEPPLALNPAA